MGLPPYPSRKQWEHVYIVQALWERGCLAPGKRGVGFGVGKEREPALFAQMGCDILATDQVLTSNSQGWQSTGQLSTNRSELFFLELIDRETFDRHVEFENVDMNKVPEHFYDRFDFTYSSCSLEHLGSITHGMRFIEQSLKCLKPGGWAVHTTEFNLGSNTRTAEKGSSVFFRKKDLELLTQLLREKGYFVENIDFSRGERHENYYVDHPPFKSVHIVLFTDNQTITSILLIAQRPVSMHAVADDIEWPSIANDNGLLLHSRFFTRMVRSVRKRMKRMVS